MEDFCGHLLRATGEPCARPAGHELPHRPMARQELEDQPTRRTERDLAYGRQLGVAPGEALPAAIGSASATARPPRRNRMKFGKVETRFVDPKPVGAKKPPVTPVRTEGI
ncbi:hypothetical protein [Amycolatopsis palatopharyngis]|uniref:hypothetical protein n=1 Tax=Amycolatopsis palatopharyngis TaxID=187982 RepID=UPI000E2552A6|nr:hypothetical protein [Amycolatopsis palatopharyngis]